MCGIIGCLGNYILSSREDILNSIAHRGPDDQGFYEDDDVFLGQVRLSIQDLSHQGHQPMFSSDGNFVIVFNGEIYNHWEIRSDLETKYAFTSSSDTETLLYGFIEYGADILNKLNGIFAFAVYNIDQKEIFIARDQLGVKPLYYSVLNEAIYFGSELKSFLPIKPFSREIRSESLFSYTNLLWSPGMATPFAHVKKLLPGHFLKLNLNEIEEAPEPHKYYDVPLDGSYSSKREAELIDELDEQLNRAVKAQLLSDVPVGFFLSGGLDSSLLVAIAKRHCDSTIQTFTINAPDIDSEGFSDDLHYAKIVADYLKVELEIVDADIDIVNDFDDMIWHLDEPQADAAPLNVSNICARAKQMGFKVLIGGAGGDDLFSGYRRHQTLKYNDLIGKVPMQFRKVVSGIFEKIYPFNSLVRRIKKGLKNIDQPHINRMAGYYSWMDVTRNRKLFKIEESLDWKPPTQYLIELLSNIPDEHDDLNKMLYWELKTFLVDHNLNYTDKMSMTHGVEVRVPFLDLRLVEFATKIPPHLKLKGKTTKYLLKKVAERYLPTEVIYRPKTGFGAPVRKWITAEMDDLINDYLSRAQLDKRGIFNADEVQKLIIENKKGKIDASYTIWSLLAIESWFRQFVDIK